MSYTANIIADWKVVPFGKLVRRSQYGLSEPSTPEGVPYLKMSNIRDGKVILEGADTLEVNEAMLRDYALKRGDLVFNRTNSLDLVGKMGVFHSDSPAIFASYLIRFQLHEEKADSRFVAAWFETSGAKHRLRCIATPGVSQSNINPTTLRAAMMVPRPPIDEQRKIADILSTWDEALETLDALISAKERQKQALMQQLLTGKTRVKGAKGKWKKVRFADWLTESRIPGTDGSNAKKITIKLYGRGVYPKQDRLAGSENTKYYIRKSGQFIYSKLDFLNGAFGIVPENLDGYESTLDLPSFDINPSACAQWLLYYVTRPEFYTQQLGAAAGGRKARRVNPSEFLAMKIYAPDLSEQQQITAILDTADQELTLLRTQRQTLDEQKRGLMQRLLTGKVRVIP